jgi:hypothetical protein
VALLRGLDVWPEPLDQLLNMLSPTLSHVEDPVDEITPPYHVIGLPQFSRSCKPTLNVVQ